MHFRYISFIFLFLYLFVVSHGQCRSWDGNHYSNTAILQHSWSEEFFLKEFQPTGKEIILDIGSGDGKNTERIANAIPNGKVIGIDKSLSMVNTARENTKSKNIEFKQFSGENPNFYSQYKNFFDIVTSFMTLHWIRDQEAVLKGIFVSLKPGGKAYLSVCSTSCDPIQKIADKKIKERKWRPFFKNFEDPMHRFSEEDYTNLLQKNNFHIISLKDVEHRDILDSRKNLKKQISSWLPHYHYLRNITKRIDQAEKFLEEVIVEYLKNPYAVVNNSKIQLVDHHLHMIIRKPNTATL